MSPTRIRGARAALLLLAVAGVGSVLALGRCSGRAAGDAAPPRGTEAVGSASLADGRASASDAGGPAGGAGELEPAGGSASAADGRQLPEVPPIDLSGEPRGAVDEAGPAIDHGATGTLVVRVVDRYQSPIPTARVRIRGWRSKQHPGDWNGWQWAEVDVRTDVEGLARLVHPLFGQNAGSWDDVSVVCLAVEHPDYVAQYPEVQVAERAQETVVLERGAFLVVAGRVNAPGPVGRIVDVVAHLSADVRVLPEDWLPLADGRPSCSRIPPGRHALYLTWEHGSETWASAIVEFELAEEEQKELELELFAPRTLHGRLDPAVPRPVVGGEVELGLCHGHRNTQVVFLRSFRAPVAADGSFRLENLPPGEGELIGLCEGWSSTRVAPGGGAGAAGASDELGLQQVDASFLEPGAQPFVLRMEPTARVAVTVLDPSGAPLEGARVVMWPNVTWSIGWSGWFLDREWNAVTDRAGLAVIDNLPPTQRESLAVGHEGYRMPLAGEGWGEPRREAQVALAPGTTTEITIRLEPYEGD